MVLVAHFGFWVAMVFMLSLIGILLWKMLVGQIQLHGIFLGDLRNGRAYFSVGRVQLFCCVIAVALDYVIEMFTRSTPLILPNIDLIWVALLSGSGMFYLAEKAYSLWLGSPYRIFQKGRS